jgi:hypothetical protein
MELFAVLALGRAKSTYWIIVTITSKTGIFRAYIALFSLQKSNIENSSDTSRSYNAHFTPKKGQIGPFSGSIYYICNFISAC